LPAEVGKHPIKSKLDMETLILSAMLSIQQKIELVKSFFRLPDTLYAEKYTEGCAKTYGTINTS